MPTISAPHIWTKVPGSRGVADCCCLQAVKTNSCGVTLLIISSFGVFHFLFFIFPSIKLFQSHLHFTKPCLTCQVRSFPQIKSRIRLVKRWISKEITLSPRSEKSQSRLSLHVFSAQMILDYFPEPALAADPAPRRPEMGPVCPLRILIARAFAIPALNEAGKGSVDKKKHHPYTST